MRLTYRIGLGNVKLRLRDRQLLVLLDDSQVLKLSLLNGLSLGNLPCHLDLPLVADDDELLLALGVLHGLRPLDLLLELWGREAVRKT